MDSAALEGEEPTRARKILATIVVVLTVLIVWKAIDYRMQPPPPPARAATGQAAP